MQFFTFPKFITFSAIIILIMQYGNSNELPKQMQSNYIEKSILERINNHRTSIGIKKLYYSSVLSEKARKICEKMTDSNNTYLIEDIKNITVVESGYNIAYEVVKRWINNVDNLNNIENEKFSKTGIAVLKKDDVFYICEIFN